MTTRSKSLEIALCMLMLIACSTESASNPTRGRPNAGAGGAGVSALAGTGATAGTAAPTGGDDFGNAGTGAGTGAPTGMINTGGGDCAAGHYVGLLQGNYFSQLWGNGTVSIPFATAEMSGQPGLEFWLERTERECTTDEFCADFEIKGGKLRGWAMTGMSMDPAMPAPGGVSARFEMDLEGELDCRAGELRGTLANGCYDVLGTLYRMDGSLSASYDSTMQAFVTGDWELSEMPMPNALVAPDPNIGGTGYWNAMLADEGSSPIAAGEGLCDKMNGFETEL